MDEEYEVMLKKMATENLYDAIISIYYSLKDVNDVIEVDNKEIIQEIISDAVSLIIDELDNEFKQLD